MNTTLACISVATLETGSEVVNNMSLLSFTTEMSVQNFNVVTGISDEEAAALALSYELFIKDRVLHRTLLKNKRDGSSRVYLVKDYNGTPVGVGMVIRSSLYVYVARGFRRKGVGTLIIKAVRKRTANPLIGAPGIPGWDLFFKKNGVACQIV